MEMILNGGKKIHNSKKDLGVARDYKIDFEGISHFIKTNMMKVVQLQLNVGPKNLWTK
jgi:hypothetical protein